MSRTDPSDLQAIVLEVPCFHCDADIGTWCTTSSGRWAEHLHGVRSNPIYQAFSLGHQEGETGVICTIRDAREEGDGWTKGWLERKTREHHCTRHQRTAR